MSSESNRAKRLLNALGEGRLRTINRARPQRLMVYSADALATTITSVGIGAPTVDGTVTSVDQTSGPFQRHATTATIGNVAGMYSPASVCAASWQPRLAAKFFTGSSVADIRYWIGAWKTTPEATADATGLHVSAFRFDTGAGDTTWKAITSGSSSPTVVDTGVACAANTRYDFEIDNNDGTGLTFFINGLRVARIETTLPAEYQRFGWRCTALAAVIKRGFWSMMKLEF